MAPKRLGRPRLPKGTALKTVLQIRLRPDEAKAIREAAKASGKTVSDWIRGKLIPVVDG